MQHPEYMHIIVQQMQAERRREASEPFVPPFAEIGNRAGRSIRHGLGKTLIQVGFWLGGHALRSEPRFNFSPQES